MRQQQYARHCYNHHHHHHIIIIIFISTMIMPKYYKIVNWFSLSYRSYSAPTFLIPSKVKSYFSLAIWCYGDMTRSDHFNSTFLCYIMSRNRIWADMRRQNLAGRQSRFHRGRFAFQWTNLYIRCQCLKTWYSGWDPILCKALCQGKGYR